MSDNNTVIDCTANSFNSFFSIDPMHSNIWNIEIATIVKDMACRQPIDNPLILYWDHLDHGS